MPIPPTLATDAVPLSERRTAHSVVGAPVNRCHMSKNTINLAMANKVLVQTVEQEFLSFSVTS